MNQSNKQYLGIILGPMFSGKTTRLIQLYKTHTYIGKKVAVINHSFDNRYSNSMLSTHDKLMIPCLCISDLQDAWLNSDSAFCPLLREADTILINEAQFFSSLKEVVLEMVEIHKKTVILCGLDGDFKRNMFGDILSLIPYCDSLEKLTSLCVNCKDGTAGIFSHRVTSEKNQIVIGSDNYQPLCRKCYIFLNNRHKNIL